MFQKNAKTPVGRYKLICAYGGFTQELYTSWSLKNFIFQIWNTLWPFFDGHINSQYLSKSHYIV